MKIIVIGEYHHETYAKAFYHAFTEMGHDTLKFDYDDYLYKISIFAKILNKIHSRLHIGPNVVRLNKSIVDCVRRNKPDLVFFYKNYAIYPRTIRQIRDQGTVVITYNNDDPFSGVPSKSYYRYCIKGFSEADFNYLFRKKNIEDCERIGVTNTGVLLPYYIKHLNYPIECEKDIDVAFMGHYENDGRDLCIKALIEAGINVKVFGSPSWYSSPIYNEIKSAHCPAVYNDEYNSTMNKVKISLVFLSQINSDSYTTRTFEIPSTKTLMMSVRSADMEKWFPDKECAVYFDSSKDLVEKCNYLLSNCEQIDKIAQNGYNRLQSLKASEFDRCDEIIEKFNQIKVIQRNA